MLIVLSVSCASWHLVFYDFFTYFFIDLPTYTHLLTPRTKAFSVCMEKLGKKVEAIYDVTFAFSCTLPPLEGKEALPRYASPSYFRE